MFAAHCAYTFSVYAMLAMYMISGSGVYTFHTLIFIYTRTHTRDIFISFENVLYKPIKVRPQTTALKGDRVGVNIPSLQSIMFTYIRG